MNDVWLFLISTAMLVGSVGTAGGIVWVALRAYEKFGAVGGSILSILALVVMPVACYFLLAPLLNHGCEIGLDIEMCDE